MTGLQIIQPYFMQLVIADYLSVNRSAMSAELSRMQREGLLCADRSSFTLRQPE